MAEGPTTRTHCPMCLQPVQWALEARVEALEAELSCERMTDKGVFEALKRHEAKPKDPLPLSEHLRRVAAAIRNGEVILELPVYWPPLKLSFVLPAVLDAEAAKLDQP